MKYVLEDFFRMVTPRIADAGRFKKTGNVWLLISSPGDTEDIANSVVTDKSVMIEYDPVSQIIANINIFVWNEEANSDTIAIYTQTNEYSHISSIVDIVDWNDIIELCREYVNTGGLRG